MTSHQTLCLRALRRALELSDGLEQLAEELQLSAQDLRSKLDGVSHIPAVVFFRVVNLLVDRGVAVFPGRGQASASLVKWLPFDVFERLAPEKKATYVLALGKQLGL